MDEETLRACVAWTEERFARESATHRWILAEMEARGFPPIQISPLEGRLLALLAATVGATRLLEVGTLGGYSALWLVSLLGPEARLLTLEREPEHARLAREAARRAGEEERIRVRTGDARAILAELGAAGDREPLDLVFIDADKRSYPDYLEQAASLLRPGGLLLGDNAYWDGRVLEGPEGPGGEEDAGEPSEGGEDADVRGIREFNRRLAEDARFQSVIVPVRDGLAVARFVG